MEIQSKQAVAQVMHPAPPPPVADMRPSADAAAMVRDTSPETPLPVPPTATQQGLVGRLMIKEPEEVAKTAPDGPVSEVPRTLKPYGIEMLPGEGSASHLEQIKDPAE